MIAPLSRSLARASLRPAVAALPQQTAAAAARRCMTTQEERWTPATARAAEQANLIGDGASDATKVDLKAVVPNIEARWKDLPKEQQYAVFRQLEELQRKDWKELSLDEKKAAYYVSFGPHGPRKPITQPGQGVKTFTGVVVLVGATAALFFGLRSMAPPPPKTMTKEWQEAATEKSKEEKINPISGISSEGYKGKGHVQ